MTSKQLDHIRMLAESDFDGACKWAEQNVRSLSEFFDTWSQSCGAPKSVFVGHTIKMLIENN